MEPTQVLYPRIRFRALRLILLILIWLPGIAYGEEGTAPRVDSIVIDTPSGAQMLNVEIADTPELRERGLMFRQRLPDDRGMLFLYETAHPVAMWMKNTYIPLDMVFLRADGTVAEVRTGTVPQSLDVIESAEPVKAVLELGSGGAEKLGLEPGALVRHQFFGNAD
jgi:uncharacterized membrane protein (UPF0127 family)